jgi:hypothetical protein
MTCARAMLLACLGATILAVAPARADDDLEGSSSATTAARRRAKLRTYHRSFGITTWVSLAATVTIGTIRYANVVGFGEPLCTEGTTPIFGRSYGCGDGLRIQHLVSATFTTASYVTTRTLAALMPDPNDEPSRRLRMHRALSWVHLGGMIALPLLGFATSASDDRATRETLATLHLAVGYSTLAAVSAAGALMTF